MVSRQEMSSCESLLDRAAAMVSLRACGHFVEGVGKVPLMANSPFHLAMEERCRLGTKQLTP